MSVAFAEARAAERRGEVPVGAALACGGKVIASAGNRTREAADPTAHAEMLVIREAAERLGASAPDECDLYVTLEPCAMCAGAISFARLRRLYYAAPDPKGGAVEHGPRFFAQPTCHHVPEIYGGLREGEAGAMLRASLPASAGEVQRANSRNQLDTHESMKPHIICVSELLYPTLRLSILLTQP